MLLATILKLIDNPPHSRRTHRVVLYNFLLSIRAALTTSQRSPSCSSHLSLHYTRRILLAIVLAAVTLIDIIPVTLYCTTSRCLCHSESCTNHVTKLAIILAIISATSYLSS